MFFTTRAVAAILGDIPCVCGRGEGKEGKKKRGGEGGGRRDGDEEEEGKEKGRTTKIERNVISK